MAEITQASSPRGQAGKVRSKKHSTKTDMTPMVDLAFLLLTFFILTATFHKPRVLPLQMPDRPEGPPPRANAANVLNLVLGKDDKIYWWMGIDPPVEITDYSKNGVRALLLNQRTNRDLTVLIKPRHDSRFANVVDILDEMKITGTDRYAIVDYDERDSLLLQGR